MSVTSRRAYTADRRPVTSRLAPPSRAEESGFLAWLLRFLRKQAVEISGLLLLALALALALALLSYSPKDPSFNHATGTHPANFLGFAGAASADLLVQLLGLGSAALILPLVAWGWYLYHSETWRLTRLRRWIRLLTWPVALVSLSGFAAALPLPANWPLAVGLGGVIGDGTAGFLARAFAAAGPGRAQFLATLMAGTAAIFSLSAATGFGARELWRLSKAVLQGLSVADEAAARLWERLEPLRLRLAELWDWAVPRLAGIFGRETNIWDHERAVEPSFSARRQKAGVNGEKDEEAPDEDASARVLAKRVVKVPSAPARSSAREAREAQGALNLSDAVDFTLPPLGLLAKPKPMPPTQEISEEALEQNARLLEAVLEDFGIRGEILHVRPGPVVTLYELRPAPGIKSSRIISLADDIARSMSAVSARVAVIPGRNVIGIELPNQYRETVYLRELLSCPEYEKASWPLTLALGKTIGGEPVVADIGAMPHLLIAGTTGSGKSVAINTMILSLLYRLTPERCRMILIDPKMLELSVYDGIPHLLAPVVTEPKKAVVALKWVVKEMEDRYRRMSKLGVRNIAGFNQRLAEAAQKGEILKRTVQTGFDRETGAPVLEEEELNYEALPFIVVVVDEMADLMMVAGKEIEAAVQRLAQMARAAGIHLITATQRPSVDVITGTIKANFPTRISFQVTSKIDSRTILGEQGAEQLLGQGDMLYMAGGGRIRRVHGPFVSDVEVEEVVSYLKRQATPEYLDAVTQGGDEDEAEDPFGLSEFGGEGSGDQLYDQAVAIVARERRVSTSYIQRRLQIGYNRAARIVEQMEEQGIVSPPNHQGKREILVGDHSGVED
jgi:DNA segregation ATPase FtsK/SpoIIIE, S-DNA-T family